MKQLTTLSLILFCAGVPLGAQQLINKNYLPAVVPLEGEYLYIAETEVSNREYGEYLNWLRTRGYMDEYHRNYPDTLVWRSNLAYNEPYVYYYLTHPAYGDYPVVGVTQKQAQNFCRWKAGRIMEYLKTKKRNDIDHITVRLPSETEWMAAARGTLPESAIYPWKGNTIRIFDGKSKDQGKIRLNIRRDLGDQGGVAGFSSDAGMITTPVYSYWPNTIGLYNICGNVAEWLEEPGKTKGGSWNEPAYNARIDQPGMFDGDTSAKSTIGFRYVVEVVSCSRYMQSEPLQVDAKSISKQLGYVPGTGSSKLLFASLYETTNGLYNTFLSENKNDTLLAVQNQNWDKEFRYEWYRQYGWHKAYADYPVVNVSYESALKFCEWLTNKYNNSENRKYKKVLIRLPSEAEWELAARGGRNHSYYPWGGPYTRNSRGCYLANFCPLEDEYLAKSDKIIEKDSQTPGHYMTSICSSAGHSDTVVMAWQYCYPGNDFTISRPVDGSAIPARADSYFPNDFGLYNMAGNAAEMLAEKGLTKGGSWNSNQYYIRIEPKEMYNSPSPDVGFRFFMEVVEK